MPFSNIDITLDSNQQASIQNALDDLLANERAVIPGRRMESTHGAQMANIDCAIAHFVDKQAEPR